MKKRQYYRLEIALVKDDYGNFIPAEKLDWRPRFSWNPFDSVWDSWDAANVARIEKQKESSDFYYRVVKT